MMARYFDGELGGATRGRVDEDYLPGRK